MADCATMALGIICLVLCAVLWFYCYSTTLRFHNFSKKVGGPRGLPLIGVLHRVLSMKDLLYILPQFTVNNKSAFFWLGPKATFYTYDPEKIKKILNSPECINKSEIYDVLDREMGSGLLTTKSPTWDKHRRLMVPCFSHKNLLSFFPIFNKKTNEVLLKLDKLVGCGENDILMLLKTLLLQTSYATTVDEDISNSKSKDLIYLNTIFKRSINLLMRYDVTYRFFKSYNEYQDSKKIVRSFLESVLGKKLAQIEGKCDQDLNICDIQKESFDIVKSKSKIIDKTIDSFRKNIMSWQEVRDETYVIIAASFETTATSLHNILMFMAMYPEYQDKLFEEIVSVFPEKNFDINFEQLDDLVYMDMCIDESLRLAPSVPLISRLVSRDTQIEDDLWIPHDTMVIMDVFNMQRCEGIWGPNANKFNPENFLPENQRLRHAYSYIPFSKGPRNCIGWRYAKIFQKIALSKIIRNYRISTKFRHEDLRCIQHITLRYEVTPKLEIHRR